MCAGSRQRDGGASGAGESPILFKFEQSGVDISSCGVQAACSAMAETAGQLVEVKFMPRTAARKEYTLFVMCDSWIGADQLVPLKLKVRREKTCTPDCCPDWRGSNGASAVPLIANIQKQPVSLPGSKQQPVDSEARLMCASTGHLRIQQMFQHVLASCLWMPVGGREVEGGARGPRRQGRPRHPPGRVRQPRRGCAVLCACAAGRIVAHPA